MWSVVGLPQFSNFYDIFISIITYTTLICATVGLLAGLYAVYLNILYNHNSDTKIPYRRNKLYILYIPVISCLVAALISFIQCTLSTIMITAICTSIDYTMNVEVALGFGVVQACVLCYIHTGKIEFVHR